MKQARVSLAQKAFLAVILILLPILITFIVGYSRNKEHLEGHILDDLTAVAEAYKGQVYQFLEMLRRRAEDFASDGFIRERLKEIVEGRVENVPILNKHLVKNKMILDETIYKISILSLYGRVVASTVDRDVGEDLSGERLFLLGQKATTIVEAKDTDGVSTLAISTPVRAREGGQTIGVLVNFVRLSELSRLLLGEFTEEEGIPLSIEKKRKTMEVYIVNGDKLMITESIFIKDAMMRQIVDTEPVRRCLANGEDMEGFYNNYLGMTVAGVSMCLKGFNWTLLVEVEAEEVMAPAKDMLRDALITGVIVFGLIGGLLFVFIRTVVLPLRKISRAAEEIAEGQFDITIPVKTTDEIGLLSDAFNSMVSQIKARTTALKESEEKLKIAQRIAQMGSWEWDLVGNRLYLSEELLRILGIGAEEFKNTYDDFLRFVHPEDRGFLKSSVDKALKGEESLSVEFRLLRADGMERYIHSEGEVTFGKDGRAIKMVGTIQDITERKRVEEEIRMLARFPAESPFPVMRITKDGILQYANSASELLVSEWCYREGCLTDENRKLILETYESQKSKEIEVRVRDRIFTIIIVPIVDTGYLYLYGLDITDRRKAEEEELRRRDRIAKQQEAIVRLTTTIFIEGKDLDSIFDMITRLACETMDVARTGIWLFEEEGRELKCVKLYSRSDETYSSGRVLNTDNYPEFLSALESGWPIDASNATEDARTIELRDAYLVPEGVTSLLVAPVRLAGRMAGGVFFEDTGNGRGWRPDEVSFATEVAEQTAQAIIADEHRRTEFELKKLSAAIEHSINVVFITDVSGIIQYVNPMFEKITEYSQKEAIGQKASILSSGETPKELYEDMWRTILSGRTWRGILKNKRKGGGFYWCNSVVTPIKDEKGEITHFLAVQEDITEKRISEERIQYLASYDVTTGLFNRTRFMKELNDWISYSRITKKQGVFFLVDLDHFKFINDTYGHIMGDEILRRMARLIQMTLRETLKLKFRKGLEQEMIIGRISSDEFGIFIPSVNKEQGIEVAEILRKKIESFRPVEAYSHLTASIGIVIYPEHGDTTKELITKADAAMYRAKELGRNKTHVYRPEDRDLENIHSRLIWKERILDALEEDRFVPWFQPVLDLRENRVNHYEALARMEDEKGNILLPGAFIDIAERFGIIGSIDRVMIEKTMKLQAEKARQGKHLFFSMNLSGKELGDRELLTFLRNRIEQTGAEPNYLIFEITETAAVQDLDRAIKFIDALRSMGCHFSLDDFGVGFTSFLYLRELKVDFIKIDGSFIRKLHENPNDRLFVKAITSVAKGMGVRIIAESVEKKEALDILKRFDIDYAQGFLIGRPAPELLSDERVNI